MLHWLGQPQEKDECLLHEQHEDCFLELAMTLDGKYVTINSSTKTSSEVSLAMHLVTIAQDHVCVCVCVCVCVGGCVCVCVCVCVALTCVQMYACFHFLLYV